MKKYSKAWVLQDTINFYTLENRAVDCFEKCQYLTEDGKKCAIGRYLKKGHEKELMECPKSVEAFLNISAFAKIIPSWMKKIEPDFLKSIQVLHDKEEYWTETGLSKEGIENVKRICKNNEIDFNQIVIKE